MIKKTVLILGYPNALAIIAAHLLYMRAYSYFDVSYELVRFHQNEPFPDDALEKFGYFDYVFLDPVPLSKHGYDYIIDINFASVRTRKKSTAFDKKIMWDIEIDENAALNIGKHIEFFVNRGIFK